MGPRMGIRGKTWYVIRFSFSKYASMGPRMGIRGKAPGTEPRELHRGPLQWGRGWGSAESSPPSGERGNQVASMGPRMGIRGKAHRLPPLPSPSKRFNGAADGDPRKVDETEWNDPLLESLQWGRGWGSAESQRVTRFPVQIPLASMGPRMGIRGKSTAARDRPQPWACFNGAADGDPRKEQ